MIRKFDYSRYRNVDANLLLHGPMGKTCAIREIIGSDEKLETVEIFGELVLIRQSGLFIGWRYTHGVTMDMLREFVEMMCDKFRYLVLFNVDDIPVGWYSGLNSLIEFVNRRKVHVLCTCRSISGLSSSFVSRFLLVRVRGFTDDEIVKVCSQRLGETEEFIRGRYAGFHPIIKGNMTLALCYLGMKIEDAKSNKVVKLLGTRELDIRRLMEEPLELGFVLRLLSYKYSLKCLSDDDLKCLIEISKLKYESRDLQYHMIDKFIKMKENNGVLATKENNGVLATKVNNGVLATKVNNGVLEKKSF
jgi:hypothetical protein